MLATAVQKGQSYMNWPVHATKTVYTNRWIRVLEDQVSRPDGTSGIYGVVEMVNDAVFVVAMTDNNEVLLVTIDRHTVGRSVEIPAGGTDGEDALIAAKRELLEETGYVASNWRKIGEMNALNGITRAHETVFLATGLSQDTKANQHQHEEGISLVQKVSWPELIRMIRSGSITDGETIAALMHAAIALQKIG